MKKKTLVFRRKNSSTRTTAHSAPLTEPVVEAEESAIEPVEPVAEVAEPVVEPVEPVVEAEEPVAEVAEPVAEPAPVRTRSRKKKSVPPSTDDNQPPEPKTGRLGIDAVPFGWRHPLRIDNKRVKVSKEFRTITREASQREQLLPTVSLD